MEIKPVSEFTPRSTAVALAVTVAVALSGAQFASTSISVFLTRITADYGWGRAEISGAITMLYVGMAAGGPLFGIAADRFGPRAIMLPLTLLSGLLIALFAATGASLLMFYAAHLLLGLAQPGMVAYSKTIASWFARQRAMALSTIAAGVLISQIGVPPIAGFLLARVGWHSAYLIFGAAEIFIALPLLFLFFRDRPSASDGDSETHFQPVGTGSAGAGLSLGQVMRTRIYWHLIATQVCVAFCFLSTSIHAVGILTERGVDPANAVWGLSTFAIGGLAAKLITGYLLDKIDSPRVIAPFALLTLLSLVILRFGYGEVLSLSAIALFGFGCTACGPMAYLVTRYFGLRTFSTIFGSTVPIMIVLGAGSPVLAGLIFDHTGSYALALTIAASTMLVAFILFATLPSYRFDTSGSATGASRPGSPSAKQHYAKATK